MDPPKNIPNIHITAPFGWLNDPCAPHYDAATGLYHLFYQWNQHDCQWGNISWGHVTSSDLLFWKHESRQPALVPDQPYDRQGVFTGCMLPSSMTKGSNDLVLCYSSISHLPIHWDRPYPRNAAGISLAISTDGGRSWSKDPQNPILRGEPADLTVTGFRDPFVGSWRELDALLGQEATYGVVAGGTKDGPTVFLYRLDPDDLASWAYLGTLINLPRRFRPSQKWSGCYGTNWECVNFLELQCADKTQTVLLIGAEGDSVRAHQQNYTLPPSVSPRGTSWQLWLAGDLVSKGETAQFKQRYGGVIDYGVFYAATSSVHPVTDSRVVYGWVQEADISVQRARSKGWIGCLALPREIFLTQIPRVEKALVSKLTEIYPVDIIASSESTVTLQTLGIRPLPDITKYRVGSTQKQLPTLSLPSDTDKESSHSPTPLTPILHKTWELRSKITILPACRRVGFSIHTLPQPSPSPTPTPTPTIPHHHTTITFHPRDESITIDRSQSTAFTDVNTCPEKGYHTLFTYLDEEGARKQEQLQLTVYVDGNVIEVFANERFAMTTTVYPSMAGETSQELWIGAFAERDADLSRSKSGSEFESEADSPAAVFEDTCIWSGLNGDRSVIDE